MMVPKIKPGEVLKNYAKKDKRIVAIEQTNKGVSTARNVGIREGNGHLFDLCGCR